MHLQAFPHVEERAQPRGSSPPRFERNFTGRTADRSIACTASNQIESALGQGLSFSRLHACAMPANAAHVGRFFVRLTLIHISPPPPACLHRHMLGANPTVSLPKLVACCTYPVCHPSSPSRLHFLGAELAALRSWIAGQVGASTPKPAHGRVPVKK